VNIFKIALIAGLMASSAEAAPHGYVLGEQAISVIDTGVNKVIDAIGIKGGRQIAISPDARRVYVTSPVGFWIIDASSGPIKYIPLPGGGDAIALSPDGAVAYVVAPQQLVYTIDLRAGAVIATMHPGGVDSGGLALSPNGKLLYLMNSLGNYQAEIQVINPRTRQIKATISEAPDNYGDNIVITPNGKVAFTTSTGFSSFGGCSISTIDLVANKRMTRSTVGACGFPGLAMTPDGSKVLVAISGYGERDVIILDVAGKAPVGRIPVAPSGLAIEPTGRFAYIPNQSGQIAVANIATKSVVAMIPVPWGVGTMAIAPATKGERPWTSVFSEK
jgi:DNA-binding beta-propeller fold protein YncE